MLITKYKPLSVVWETTLNCNMNCMHCGSSAGNQRIKELTPKEGLNLCNDLSKLGTRLVSLMGGEALLRKDWDILANHIRDLGMNVTLMSNGWLINESVVSKLVKIDPYAVTISIDGGNAKTHDSIRCLKGSFDRSFSSLELLTDANLPATVITTVSKKNFKELPVLRDLLLNRGIAWQIQLVVFQKVRCYQKMNFIQLHFL